MLALICLLIGAVGLILALSEIIENDNWIAGVIFGMVSVLGFIMYAMQIHS